MIEARLLRPDEPAIVAELMAETLAHYRMPVPPITEVTSTLAAEAVRRGCARLDWSTERPNAVAIAGR